MNTSIKYIVSTHVRWNDTPSDKLIPCVGNHEIICIQADGIDTMTPSEQAAFIFGWLSRDRAYHHQYPVEINFSVYNVCGDAVNAVLVDGPSEQLNTEDGAEAPQEHDAATITKNNNESCYGLLESTPEGMIPLEYCVDAAENKLAEVSAPENMLPSFHQTPSELLTAAELARLSGMSITTVNRKLHRARLEPCMFIRGKRVFDSKKALEIIKTNQYALLTPTKLNPAKQPDAFIDFAYMTQEHKINRHVLENLIANGLPGMLVYKKVYPQVFYEVDAPPYKYIFEKEAYYKLYNAYINNEL